MKAYEAIAECVLAEGVNTVFALMGDANLDLLAYLESRQASVTHATRHENSVVAMASGYAQATGSVGFCTVSSGPALANAAVALTTAARSHTPLVLLTGPASWGDTNSPQRFDHAGLAALTGAAYEPVYDVDSVPDLVWRAFYRARTTKAPVVLDVPVDLQDQPYDWPLDYHSTADALPPVRPIQVHAADVGAAHAIIAESQRPIIIAGSGATDPDTVASIRELASRIGALLATALPGRGIFDGDPFSIGIAGLFSTSKTMELFAEADCVIAIGASLNYYTTEGGYLFQNAKVVHVDTRETVLTSLGRPVDCYVRADAGQFASALLEAHAETVQRYRTDQVRAEIAADPIDDYQAEIGLGELDPRAVCTTISERLTPATTLVIGAGHFWAFPVMHIRGRSHSTLFSNQFGSIGLGLPVAIGAAHAHPQQSTILIEGDASVMMSLADLEALGRQAAKLLVVVMNDQALGAEFHKLSAKGMDPQSATTPQLDIAEIATALGCTAMRISSEAELEAGLQKFEQQDKTMLLDVAIARSVVSAPYRRLYLGTE